MPAWYRMNPYSSPAAVDADSCRDRRLCGARDLLTAYAVHHVGALIGLVIACLLDNRIAASAFPPDKPWAWIISLLDIPVVDLASIMLPVSDMIPDELRWQAAIRAVLTVSIVWMLFRYSKHKKPSALWYVGVCSSVTMCWLVWTIEHLAK
jgi:hypothetical protein